MEISEILDCFSQEFAALVGRFHIRQIAVSDVAACAENYIANPGVYVFWRPGGAIKVGRHLTNARKRAKEHIRANTGGTMAGLAASPDARLILFSVIDPADRHWVAALEIYLESQVKPTVRAARLG